jgi:hypothetical protein
VSLLRREVVNLIDAYEEVQRRKDDASRAGVENIDAATVRIVVDRVLDEFTRANPVMVAQVIGGMAWVIHMCEQEGYDLDETMEVCERIGATVRRSLPTLGTFTPEQAVEVGIGAGFWTGLWLAGVAKEER